MSNAKFDGYAAQYDSWFINNENVFLSELKLLKSALDLTDGGRMLSIGCGSGLFEEQLRTQYGINVTDGVEPSEDMATIAKCRGMSVQIATAETAQLEENSYDVIYFNGSSSYIADLKLAYGNVLTALKPGGSLILLDVPKESAYGLLYLLAAARGSYDGLEDVAPADSYPIELARSAYWHTTPEKSAVLTDELGLHDLQYRQTLSTAPIYSNDFVEEPREGFDRGGYVAIIARR